MALLFIDSFDHYDTAHILSKWTTASPLPAIASGQGRCGSNCMRLNGATSLHKGLAFDTSSCTVGFALNIVSEDTLTGGAIGLLTLGGTNGDHVTLWYHSNDGSLSVVRQTVGADEELGRTAPDVIRQDSWYFIEWQATIGGAVSVLVRINNVEVLDLAGVNTIGEDAAGDPLIPDLRYLVFDCDSNKAWMLDDLYVLDDSGPAPWNTFLGDSRIEYLRPTAPGTSQAWDVVGAATHWQAVDDAAMPDDDTTYLTTTTAGETDTEQYSNTSLPTGSILGAQLSLLARKTDSGPRMLAPVVRHSGTNDIGDSQAPSATDYHYLIQVYPVNPVTEVAWTIADINAAEFGVQVTE